jgi:hypothetical protein
MLPLVKKRKKSPRRLLGTALSKTRNQREVYSGVRQSVKVPNIIGLFSKTLPGTPEGSPTLRKRKKTAVK